MLQYASVIDIATLQEILDNQQKIKNGQIASEYT